MSGTAVAREKRAFSLATFFTMRRETSSRKGSTCRASGTARSGRQAQHLVDHGLGRRGIEGELAGGRECARIVVVDLQIVLVGGHRAIGGSIDQAQNLRALGIGKLARHEELFHLTIFVLSFGGQEEPQRTLGMPANIFRVQIADRVLDVLKNLD